MSNRTSISTKPFSLDEKIDFFTELGTYVKASIPLSTALTKIIKNSNNPKIKKSASSILKYIDKGENFSASILRFEHILGSAYCNLLSIGNDIGEIPQIIQGILDTLKKQRSIKRSIIKSCTYPIVLFIVFCICAAALIFIIVPKVSTQAELMTGEIPLTLKIISKGWFIILLLIVFGVFSGIKAIKYSLKNKSIFSIPIIGKTVKTYNIALFFRIFSLAYTVGIPVTNAYPLASKAVINNYIKNRLLLNSSMLLSGETLSETFRSTDLLSPQEISKIEAGEMAGNLEDIFKEICGDINERLETTISAALSVVEPFFIFIVGILICIFGFIILGPANPFNYL